MTPARTGSSRPSPLNSTAVPSAVGVKASRPSRSFLNPCRACCGCPRIRPCQSVSRSRRSRPSRADPAGPPGSSPPVRPGGPGPSRARPLALESPSSSSGPRPRSGDHVGEPAKLAVEPAHLEPPAGSSRGPSPRGQAGRARARWPRPAHRAAGGRARRSPGSPARRLAGGPASGSRRCAGPWCGA